MNLQDALKHAAANRMDVVKRNARVYEIGADARVAHNGRKGTRCWDLDCRGAITTGYRIGDAIFSAVARSVNAQAKPAVKFPCFIPNCPSCTKV